MEREVICVEKSVRSARLLGMFRCLKTGGISGQLCFPEIAFNKRGPGYMISSFAAWYIDQK